MKEVFSCFLLTAIVFSAAFPASAQRIKMIDLLQPRVLPKAVVSPKTKFETVEAYSSGSGAWVRWRMESELENFGFYVYRVDDKGRSKVSDEPTLASARVNGQTLYNTEYKLFDKKGAPGAIYQVETLPLKSAVVSSDSIQTKLINDLSSVGLGGKDFILPKVTSGNVVTRDAMLEGDLKDEVAAGTKASDINNQRWVASQEGVKIGVKGNGIYRVTKAQLQTGGFNVNADPSTWQLYRDGVQQAIIVAANGNYIEFYGTGIDTAESDTSVYYLIAGSGPGLRMANRVSRPSLGTVLSKAYTETFTNQVRVVYYDDILNGNAGNFFSSAPIAAPPISPYQLTFNLSSIDTTSPTFVINVNVQGYSFTIHPLVVTLNDQPVGNMSGLGRNAFSSSFTLPTSMLVQGTNTLKIVSTASNDFSVFDTLRITYNRGYAASQDQLSFITKNYKVTKVTGFTNANVRLFDITEDGRPVLMTGLGAVATGGTFTLNLPAARSRRFLASSDNAILQPTSVEFNTTSALASQIHSSNLLILTYKDFGAAANDWADYRRGQGITAEVINVSDIFDEYSYGVPQPDAIKSFLQDAYNSSATPPQYVLLLGDSTYDPRGYRFPVPFRYFVPAKIVPTVFTETASDDSLTDFNGDGLADIAIGRIPAKSAQEVTNALARVATFEQPALQTLDRGTLFAYDVDVNIDFEGMSNRLKNELPAGTAATLVKKGTAGAEGTIVSEINSGKYLVNYSGHGAVGVWSNTSFFSVLNVSACTTPHPCITNANTRSIFTLLTCLNGYFIDADGDSLAEGLMMTPNGGAVAAWASTGLTNADVQEVMGRRFYNQVGVGNIKRMGDLVLDAKAQLAAGSDVRFSWALLGDPMLKVHP